MFTTKRNILDVVDAGHPNSLQEEVTALQTAVGLNPHISTAGGGSSLGAYSAASRTYLTLSDRIANTEAGIVAATQGGMYSGVTETVTGYKTFAPGAQLGTNSAGVSAVLTLAGPLSGSGESSIMFRTENLDRWKIHKNAGDTLLRFRDMTNARDHVTFTPGANDSVAQVTLATGLTATGRAVFGTVTAGGTTDFGGSARLSAIAQGAAERPLLIRGAFGHTGNLTEWQNSAGTVLASVNASGVFSSATSATTTLTVTDHARIGDATSDRIVHNTAGTGWSTGQMHFNSGWATTGVHWTLGSRFDGVSDSTGNNPSGVMLGNPHIPWRGDGAYLRIAGDQAGANAWDVGTVSGSDSTNLKFIRGGLQRARLDDAGNFVATGALYEANGQRRAFTTANRPDYSNRVFMTGDGNYYLKIEWDGSRWLMRGVRTDGTEIVHAPVRAGYADSAGSAGTASTANNAEFLGNDTSYMRMHWAGQGGQPSWLWGGNASTDMYVYNPSNFSVNYANNAGALGGKGEGSLNVNYANSAGSAYGKGEGALNVNYANSAGSAPANGGNANYANSAGSAPANGGNSSTVEGKRVRGGQTSMSGQGFILTTGLGSVDGFSANVMGAGADSYVIVEGVNGAIGSGGQVKIAIKGPTIPSFPRFVSWTAVGT